MIPSLTVFSLFFMLIHSPAQAEVVDRLEASVNNQLILQSDLSDFRRTIALRNQLDPLFQGTSVEKAGKNATSQQIVSFLINEKVILNKFPVEDSEVEEEVRKIQSKNRVSREALSQALAAQGFTFEDYFELIRGSVGKKKLIDSEIRSKVSVSDDDVKNYFYNEHPGSKSSRSYKIQIITLAPNQFKSPELARAAGNKALEEIKGGADFEEVAKRVSHDSSGKQGGNLGYLSSDNISSAIAKELKNLKVGEVSGLLGDSQSQYFILKLADIRSGADNKLTEMKEEIRDMLLAKEFQQQILLWIERERENAFVRVAGDSSLPKNNAN